MNSSKAGELFKHRTERLIELIAKMFNNCLLNGYNIFKDWKMAYISSIYKRGCKKTWLPKVLRWKCR